MQIVSCLCVNEIQWPDRGEAVSSLYPRAVCGFPVGTHTNPHMYNTYIDNWARSSAQTDKLSTDTNRNRLSGLILLPCLAKQEEGPSV